MGDSFLGAQRGLNPYHPPCGDNLLALKKEPPGWEIPLVGAQRGLNPQPSDPQSDVPPIELWAPYFKRGGLYHRPDYLTHLNYAV